MIERTYFIKYEDPDEPSRLRIAAVRFDPDAAITALNNLRQMYRGVVFHLESKQNEELERYG